MQTILTEGHGGVSSPKKVTIPRFGSQADATFWSFQVALLDFCSRA